MTHPVQPPCAPRGAPSDGPPEGGARQRRGRLPLSWAVAGVAAAAALVGAATAWALTEALGVSSAVAAPVAAALAVLTGALPMLALVLKSRPEPVAGPPRAEEPAPAALDGITPRTMFLDLAERERARARRYGTGAALLLIDLDRVSRSGEAQGSSDACEALLYELARQTAAGLRGADALARFGKTQLAVFLVQADATGALDVAERIRERAEQLELPRAAGQRARATVSVGVAHLRAAHLSLQALIDDAQDAAFVARQAGGNCVRAAPVDPLRIESPGTSRDDQRTRPQ